MVGTTQRTLRDVAYIAIAAALLVALQVAMAVLPNIELVSLLVILYTLYLGRRALFVIYAFALVEGLIYGFHIWWITYLYIWSVLYLVVRLFRDVDSPLAWAVISGLFGICFGLLCSIPYLFTLGPGGWVAYVAAGIPFDLVHCVGNFTLALLLYRPLSRVLGQIPGMQRRAQPA